MDKEGEILFLKNNHSNYRVKWVEIDPELETKLKKIVNSGFGLRAGDEIRQADEWEKKSNNFRIFAGGKCLLLRKHISIENENKIISTELLTSFLRSGGILIPRTIPCRGGELAYRHSGKLWQLFEFVPGDHYRGTDDELKDVACQVGLLHKIMSDFKRCKRGKLRPYWTLISWEKIFKMLKGDCDIDVAVRKNQDYIFCEAERVHSDLTKMGPLRMQFIHRDLHPMNTIYKNGEMKAFLDFSDAGPGELARDFGNACHRFVRQFIVNSGGGWNKLLSSGLKIFTDGYQSVNLLENNEISAAPYLMKDEILRKIFLDLETYCRKGDGSFLENGEIEKKLALLKESSVIGDYFNKIT